MQDARPSNVESMLWQQGAPLSCIIEEAEACEAPAVTQKSTKPLRDSSIHGAIST